MKWADFEAIYGINTKVEITGYWKFEFYINAVTNKGYTLRFRTGGCADDIYRYDPNSTDWMDHLDASPDMLEIVVSSPNPKELKISVYLEK